MRSVPRVFTERSGVPLVTLNLCVMRWYNLGEGDLVSTVRTIPMNRKSPKLVAQTMPIGRLFPKTIARTIQMDCAYCLRFMKCFLMIHIRTHGLGGIKTSYAQTYNAYLKFIYPALFCLCLGQ